MADRVHFACHRCFMHALIVLGLCLCVTLQPTQALQLLRLVNVPSVTGCSWVLNLQLRCTMAAFCPADASGGPGWL